MNKVSLQLWEESNRDFTLNDGCSLHIDKIERDRWLSCIYAIRNSNIPEKYDNPIGDVIDVFVSDELYTKVKNQKSIKLDEISFRNMLKFEELIYNKSEI